MDQYQWFFNPFYAFFSLFSHDYGTIIVTITSISTITTATISP